MSEYIFMYLSLITSNTLCPYVLLCNAFWHVNYLHTSFVPKYLCELIIMPRSPSYVKYINMYIYTCIFLYKSKCRQAYIICNCKNTIFSKNDFTQQKKNRGLILLPHMLLIRSASQEQNLRFPIAFNPFRCTKLQIYNSIYTICVNNLGILNSLLHALLIHVTTQLIFICAVNIKSVAFTKLLFAAFNMR